MQLSRLLWMIGLYWLVSSSTVLSQEPAVRNVQFTQRADSEVEVTYDLVGDPAKKYEVKLRLVKSGSRGVLPVSREALSGDVGEGVFPGRRLRIIWKLPKDFPQGLEGEGFVFIVEVYEQGGAGSKTKWIVGGVVVAAGLAAAVILIPQPSKTGSIIIDVPDSN